MASITGDEYHIIPPGTIKSTIYCGPFPTASKKEEAAVSSRRTSLATKCAEAEIIIVDLDAKERIMVQLSVTLLNMTHETDSTGGRSNMISGQM